MREQRPLVALIAVAAFVSLVPVALLGMSTNAMAEKVVADEVRRHVRTTATVSASLVAEQLSGLTELVDSYASRPSLRSLMEPGPHGADGAAMSALVEPLSAARAGIRGTFVTDLSGVLTHAYPSTPGIVGKDFSFRDWYVGVTTTGATYVSEAYEAALVGNPRVVAIATLIRGADGEPRAILAAIYSLEAINETAGRVADAQGVRLTVTDQRGVVLAAPGAKDASGLVSVRDELGVRRALRGKSGVIRSDTADGPALAAYSPVRPLRWTVMAELPTDDVLAPARDLRRDVLVLSVLEAAAILAGLGLLIRALRRARTMETALRFEEARTRGIIETANDAFIGMNVEGVVDSWNRAAQDTFGWTAEETVGRRLSDLIVPERYRAAHEEGLRRYLETGEGPVLGQRIEITGLRKDGAEVPVELSIFATKVGDATHFNAFVQDITTRRAEAEALATARDQAMEASRLKSEFLANMSHEIRTPMNGVLGMTSLLLDSPLSREQRVFAESVMSSGESLLSIINDILDFSKIEAGKLDIETIDFDLRELIESTVELLAPRAHEKHLEVAAFVDTALPDLVRGDPGRVRQVLTNLVGNAIKFTPRGEVVVRAQLESVDEPDGHVRARISVTDTGIGIDDTTRERLFEAFAQADTSTTRKYGGTGLGLAISKQLVDLMDGEIGADSVPGRGSVFWFSLPFARATTAASPRRKPREDLRGLRVLVVDDNATNREVIKQFLRSWSMEGVETPGGAQAVEAMRAAAAAGRPFDVAVVDLNMPDMDGMEVGRHVKTDPLLAPTRLVLLTSSAQRGEVADAQRFGFDGYLTKPVRQSHLLDTLATVMSDAHPGDVDDEPRGIVTRHTLPEEQRPRILVAEDNEVSQRVAVGMLQRLGYRADVVSNGAEAVEAAQRGQYAAVIMDCQMPVMDGYEAAQEIRRRELEGAHLPIIALSASAMAGDADAALATGMDDYLTKPIAADALASSLATWAPLPAVEAAAPARPQGAGTGETTGSDVPILDPAKLTELESVGGTEFVDQLFGLFVSSAPERMAQLRAAVASGDRDGAARMAHTLRGGAANVGATALAAACAAAEAAGREGDDDRLAAATDAIATQLSLVVAAAERRNG